MVDGTLSVSQSTGFILLLWDLRYCLHLIGSVARGLSSASGSMREI